MPLCGSRISRKKGTQDKTGDEVPFVRRLTSGEATNSCK